MADAFYGEIRAFAFNFAPQDWAHCDGSPLPFAQYQALLAVIGMTYGGSQTARTFNLPDLRGRAPMHWGSVQAPSGNVHGSPGTTMGTPNVTLMANQTAAHTHQASGMQATTGTPTNIPSASTLITRPRHTASSTTYDAWSTTDPAPTTLHDDSVSPTGGTNGGAAQAHTNVSPFLALNFCICLNGAVFPVKD